MRKSLKTKKQFRKNNISKLKEKIKNQYKNAYAEK